VAGKRQKRRNTRKPAPARRKFSTPSQTRIQLEAITAAQERYRREKRRRQRREIIEQGPGVIIESREKSEQAWKNVLRAVRRPEDLDGFE
jgi:hypothetical protein